MLQPFWSPKPHIYSVDRFEVPDKKAALAELQASVAGRYIRVVHEQDRAFLTTDIRLLALDFVFSARLAVLTDDDELGAVLRALARTELEARASRVGRRWGSGGWGRPHGRSTDAGRWSWREHSWRRLRALAQLGATELAEGHVCGVGTAAARAGQDRRWGSGRVGGWGITGQRRSAVGAKTAVGRVAGATAHAALFGHGGGSHGHGRGGGRAKVQRWSRWAMGRVGPMHRRGRGRRRGGRWRVQSVPTILAELETIRVLPAAAAAVHDVVASSAVRTDS